MRNNKSYKRDRRDYEDEDGHYRAPRRKDQPRRRPVKNWTKAWEEHQNNPETLEDFFVD